MAKRKYTGTVDEFFLFCRDGNGNMTASNNLASGFDFDVGGGETFDKGTRLSHNGLEPFTHIGVSTVCDEEMNTGILSAITQGTPYLKGFKKSDGFTFESAMAAHPDGALFRIDET